MAAGIERLATNVRHWQRTEVGEAEEAFTEGQKGSSAMPHKRNPILSENLCGLARVVRAAVVPALEDVALWHERDISHSSVERMIAPDATATLGFMLERARGARRRPRRLPREPGEEPRPRRRSSTSARRCCWRSSSAGMPRQEAYVLVQRNAMKAWRGEGRFRALLGADADVKAAWTCASSIGCSISTTRSRTCPRSWSGR